MRDLHSKIGASSCERFWNCPGSITRYGHLESRAGFAAAQGTAAHGVAEDTLNALIEISKTGVCEGAKPYQQRLGDTVRIEDNGSAFDIKVDEDMLEAVGTYVQFIDSLLDKYLCSYSDLAVEVGFDLAHIHMDAYGTCDAVLWSESKGRLVVIDYKHGAGVAVEAVDNKQTRYYALGAYYAMPITQRKHVRNIEFIIVQPRCPHPDGTIRRDICSVEELMEWEKELTSAIMRVANGDMTLKSGSHCKFCPAKPQCPEAANEVARLAEIDFAGAAFTQEPVDPKTLTPEQLAHLLGFVPFIKEWCNSLWEHAYNEAERGVTIPGYRLAAKRTNRQWAEGVEEELEWLLGDKIYAKKLLSPAQAEKLLPKKQRRLLEDFWIRPPASNTLVKNDSDKPTKLPSIQTDFIDVDFESL